MSEGRGRVVTVLRWIARVWSIAGIALILAIFRGEGFAPGNVVAREWISLAFFPGGVVVGMLIGWWKEGWGGAITILSLVAFYVYNYLLSGAFPSGWAFIAFSAPGLLFLVCAMLSRRLRHDA